MPKPDDDFTLNLDAQEVLDLLGVQLGVCVAAYSTLLRHAGLTEVQAIGAIAQTLISDAALISVKNRIENLDGEPSLERWQTVTDIAWDAALNNATEAKEGE